MRGLSISKNTSITFFMFAIVVEPPLWWGLLCTCTLCTLGNPALHLRLIGKLVGDFLLVIIERFSLGAFVLSHYTRVTDDGPTDSSTITKTTLAYNARGKNDLRR